MNFDLVSDEDCAAIDSLLCTLVVFRVFVLPLLESKSRVALFKLSLDCTQINSRQIL